MTRWMTSTASIGFVICICSLGCKEEMVGAPCRAETDKGVYNENLKNTTYSVEARSNQCETSICLTKTEKTDSLMTDECEQDPTVENCWNNRDQIAEKITEEPYNDPVHIKYSFCSCRCADVNNNSYSDNPDKYDYLCECPPDTECEVVLSDIDNAPKKLKGSYCIPKCISTPECKPGKMCAPSKDSEKPWEWRCNDVPDAPPAAEPEE